MHAVHTGTHFIVTGSLSLWELSLHYFTTLEFCQPVQEIALLPYLIVPSPLLDTLSSVFHNYSHKNSTCCLCVLLLLVFYRSLILCCASSESSSQALSVFNRAGLLDVVVQCLERHPQNVELAISAGRSNEFAVNWLIYKGC